ncbi:MAG: fibronectin-binding autotransporter adhesin [Arenicella sp.]|jgi:fibronectin-binding autotransporter adhesin
MKLIKRQLVTAVLASTFSLAAHAVEINFDGAAVQHCLLDNNNKSYSCSDDASLPQDDIYIANTYTVSMDTVDDSDGTRTVTDQGQKTLYAASAILGAAGRLEGNLDSQTTVALGAGAEIKGNVKSGTTVALGAGAKVEGRYPEQSSPISFSTQTTPAINAGSTLALGAEAIVFGNIQAVTTIAVGANANVYGNVNAGTTFALGADGGVYGNVVADTTVALGADSVVAKEAYVYLTLEDGLAVETGPNGDVQTIVDGSGNVTAGTTVALGADSSAEGNVESLRSSVTLGVKANVKGTTKAASAVTLGASAYTCSDIHASSAATLSAGSFVQGNLNAVTLTVAAGAFVTNNIQNDANGTANYATTATLGANACYGNELKATTITLGAGAGRCVGTIPDGSCPGQL